MFDENKQNSSCSFAGQLVAYLYDEIDANGKIAFENHLNACAGCSGEIAEFGFLRASIVDWKKQSFDLLETPAIKIPAGEIIKIVEPSVVWLWFENLKKSLTISPMWATVAIVIFAVCAGLLLFAHNFSSNNLTAKIENAESPQANVLPSPENKVDVAAVENSYKTTDKNLVNAGDAEDKNFTAKSSPANTANKQIAKISNGRNIDSKPEVAAHKTVFPARKNNFSNVALKTLPSKKRQLPKLNEIEEETDENSLLLADLLDQVGGG